jgi:hypothetical protein
MTRMKLSNIAVLAVFCAIPAFADEPQLANIRTTTANMRTLAQSIEALATDTNEYPAVSFDELATTISPRYIENVPKVDAWGNPFFYIADGEHYRVVSAGADGKFEEGSRELTTTKLEARMIDGAATDIIFQDGMFIQYPTEAKKK